MVVLTAVKRLCSAKEKWVCIETLWENCATAMISDTAAAIVATAAAIATKD
jgi:Tfp pilus assembly major pilin PilA